jgi:hypothetical protein
MTPGPAFAASAPARGDADSTLGQRPARPAPAAASAAASTPAGEVLPAPAIAPPPAELRLVLPDLPPDSVVPAARTGDTMAMKKILRALNGPKPGETPAAP